MKKNPTRLYIPYAQVINVLDEMSEDEAMAFIVSLAEKCYKLLNVAEMAKRLGKKYRKDKDGESLLFPEGQEMLEAIKNAPCVLDAMVQLTFLVNKCTKDFFLTEDEVASTGVVVKGRTDRYDYETLKKLGGFSEEEFVEISKFLSYSDRTTAFYEMKGALLTAIIKELGTNPQQYQNYIYGFIEDDISKPNEVSFVFAISIPGIMGTFQFHIKPSTERSVLFDVDCQTNVKHVFQPIAAGNTSLSQMSFFLTKDQIMNIDEVEAELERMKEILSNYREKDVDIIRVEESFRKLYLYSVLLGKDPMQELREANEDLAKNFIIEQDEEEHISDYVGDMTEEDKKRFNQLMRNLKQFGRIYISSAETVDSKVAIEVIKRKFKEEYPDCDKEIEVIEVPSGYESKQGGVYINTSKYGSSFNGNRTVICPNERLNETTVCGILEKMGFNDIPKDVVLYANRAELYTLEPNNAYYLASVGLNGAQIIELCQELQERGESLIDAKLNEEKIERYGLTTKKEELQSEVEEIQKNMAFIYIGNTKVALFSGDNLNAAYYAYAQGASIIISIEDYYKDGKKDGVTLSVQSNPEKEDLPPELIHWAIKHNYEELYIAKTAGHKDLNGKRTSTPFKDAKDMLIQRTRIILGGKTTPDIYLKDRRADRSTDFKEQILRDIVGQIYKGVCREREEVDDELTTTAIQNFNMEQVVEAYKFLLSEHEHVSGIEQSREARSTETTNTDTTNVGTKSIETQEESTQET